MHGQLSGLHRQHVPVECKVSDEARRSIVIRVQLPEAAPLDRPELGELLLPDIERRFAFTQLATGIGNGRAAVRLADGIVDLFFRKSGPLQRKAESPTTGVGRSSCGPCLGLTATCS